MHFYKVQKMRIYLHEIGSLASRKFTFIFYLDNGFKMKIVKFIAKKDLKKELRMPIELGTQRFFDDDIVEECVFVPVNQITLKFNPIEID